MPIFAGIVACCASPDATRRRFGTMSNLRCWIVIRNHVQFDAVFEKRLGAREDEAEPSG